MIIFLNHRDRLFCDVFETPNNNNDYFTIITIIGPTINRSDASLKSILEELLGNNMFLLYYVPEEDEEKNSLKKERLEKSR